MKIINRSTVVRDLLASYPEYRDRILQMEADSRPTAEIEATVRALPTPRRVVPVKSITIERAEGPSAECITRTVGSWLDAHVMLRSWSRTAPTSGGYDKCDVVIEWADGQKFATRYDMKRDCSNGTLAEDVRASITFHAGVRCPAHMTEVDYRRYLNDFVKDRQEGYKRLLAGYDLGGSL